MSEQPPFTKKPISSSIEDTFSKIDKTEQSTLAGNVSSGVFKVEVQSAEEKEEVVNEAGSKEPARLAELFALLQAGESEAIGEGALLGNVQNLKDDLSKILIAAGYSGEHDFIFDKVLSPIFDEVVLARKEEPNNHIKRNKLRKSLIETMSGIVKNRLFSEATSEDLLDIERKELSEKFQKFKTEYDSCLELIDSSPHSKAMIFHLGTDAVEKSILELEAFLSSDEPLTQKNINRANLNLVRLANFNTEIESLIRPADKLVDAPPPDTTDPGPNPDDGPGPALLAIPAPTPASAPIPPPVIGREVTGPNVRKEYDWTDRATDAETVDNILQNLRMIAGRQGADSSDENIAKIKQTLFTINESEKKVAAGLFTPEELQKIKNKSLNSLLNTVGREALNNLISSGIIITSKTEAKDILAPRSEDKSDYESAKTKLSAVRDGKEVVKTDGTTEKVGGFKAEKRAYMEALRKHHEAQGILSNAKNSLSKFFREKELELPPELIKLQNSYREKRAAYAEALEGALEKRGKSRGENNDFSLDTPEAKRAFARKFILNPRREAMELKQEVTLSKEQASKVSGLMRKMRENPRATRAFGLLAAAVLGAGTGGLAGGGLAVGRFILSTTVGVALAAGAFNAAQGSVDRAMKQSEAVAESTLTNFTKANLDLLEEQLLKADTAGAVAKTRQKGIAAGTAVAFGGATGLGTSALLNMPDATEAASSAGVGAPTVAQPESATPPTAAVSSPEAASSSPMATAEPLTAPAPQPENVTETASSKILAEVHIVKPNDNLSTILHNSLLTQFDQGTLPAGMERAELSKLMYKKFPEMTSAENPQWTLTPEQWKGLGVESGNPKLIRVGETINVEGLMKMVADKELLPGGAGTLSGDALPSRPSTGPLRVQSDPLGDFVVPIENNQSSPIISDAAGQLLSYDPTVSGPRPFSVDGNYLSNPEYRAYLAQYLNGVSISRLVDANVDRIENITAFDVALGQPRVFDAIKDLTAAELDTMQQTPGAVESFAADRGVDENMLHEWLYNYDQIKSAQVLPYKPTTVFSDLYTRSLVETQVARNLSANNIQNV